MLTPNLPNSRMLTSKDVQSQLRIGKSTTMQLLKSGEIPSIWIAGQYRIREVDLLEYIEKNRYYK
jgi:DNA binding domain, excisionase family